LDSNEGANANYIHSEWYPKKEETMPRIRIGAFYTSGNDTGVALRVALQVYNTADGAGTPTSTTLVRQARALQYPVRRGDHLPDVDVRRTSALHAAGNA